jgi:hypothetical protein
MARQIHATITVEGDDRELRPFRSLVNELLDADRDVPYQELHAAGRLDYRTKGRGVPYPPFVAASNDFPDLTISINWENRVGGEVGHATIKAGRLTEQTQATRAAEASYALNVSRDGAIAWALACRRREAACIGYVLTATQHAFFRLQWIGDQYVLEASDGVEPEWAERWTIRGEESVYALLEPREPIATTQVEALDQIANVFADEWIWFAESPPEETAVERQRYMAYGLKIHPANVRAAKLKTVLRETPTGDLEMIAPEARDVAALLARHWVQQPRQGTQ